MKAKGAVACGHGETAAAAEEILQEGGSAFDAVLAGGPVGRASLTGYVFR